jgi:ankyrin repeat protein
MTQWLNKKGHGCLLLRTPDGLANRHFCAAIRKAAIEPIKADGVLVYAADDEGYKGLDEEQILSAFCYHFIEHSAYTLKNDLFYLRIRSELKAAFESNNSRWRLDILMLWLRVLLIVDDDIKPRVLILSFCRAPKRLEKVLGAIRRLMDLVQSTGKANKLVVLVGVDDNVPLDTETWTIDLEDAAIKEGLLADMTQWLDKIISLRPSLGRFKDVIQSNIHSRYREPLLAFSYLLFLRNRPWITEQQLEADSHLLNASFVANEVLNRVPNSQKTIVADILALLKHQARPMVAQELAPALAMLQEIRQDSQSPSKVPLDFADDLVSQLSGLLSVGSGIWVSRLPSLPPEVPGFTEGWQQSPEFHMRLARACLKYMSRWFDTQTDAISPITESTPMIDIIEWPFLHYATTHWFNHYSDAYKAGIEDTQIRHLIEQNPNLVGVWAYLYDYFYSPNLPGPYQTPAEELLAPAIAQKFNICFPDAISASCHALRATALTDGDTAAALVWGVWNLEECRDVLTKGSPETIKSSINTASLARLAPLQPTTVFELLLFVDEGAIPKVAPELLPVAVAQGEADTVAECLKHVTLHGSQFACPPWLGSIISCTGCGHATIMEQLLALPAWQELESPLRSKVLDLLLIRAVTHCHAEIVGLLLRHDFEIANSVMCWASELGSLPTVQVLLPKFEARLQKMGREECTPLHCAVGFPEISRLLVRYQPMSSVATDKDGDTPLHYAAKCGYGDTVEILLEANKRQLESRGDGGISQGENETQEEAGDASPKVNNALEIKCDSGCLAVEDAMSKSDEKTIGRLIEETPRDLLLQAQFLPWYAVLSNKVPVVEQVLALGDFDLNVESDAGYTAIFAASSNGSVEMIRLLLSHGANGWKVSNSGKTPLSVAGYHDEEKISEISKVLMEYRNDDTERALGETLLRACELGGEALFNVCVENGANINYAGTDKRTPLHEASWRGHESFVRTLLLRRADLTPVDERGETPLTEAILAGYTSIIKMLWDAGARVANHEKGALHYALKSKNLGVVKFFLDKGERLPVEEDPDNSPLVEMVRSSDLVHLEILEKILDVQADLRGTAILAKAFHVALRNDDGLSATVLLKYGANPNAESVQLYGTALHECSSYGNLRMARFLLDFKKTHVETVGDLTYYFNDAEIDKISDVNGRDNTPETPLSAALSWRFSSEQSGLSSRESERKLNWHLTRQKKMVDFLIERGADPKARNSRFGNLLNTAACRGPAQLVEYVLDNLGFDVREVDHEQRNVFHVAVIGPAAFLPDKLRLLKERANDPQLPLARDAHGRLPLHLACGVRNLDALVPLLPGSLSDWVNEADDDGWTPLHWACRQCKWDFTNPWLARSCER